MGHYCGGDRLDNPWETTPQPSLLHIRAVTPLARLAGVIHPLTVERPLVAHSRLPILQEVLLRRGFWKDYGCSSRQTKGATATLAGLVGTL